MFDMFLGVVIFLLVLFVIVKLQYSLFAILKKEIFKRHGANLNIYTALIVLAVVLIVLGSDPVGVLNLWFLLVGIFLFFLTFHVKLSHGYLFNEGRTKIYNGILLIIYNLLLLYVFGAGFYTSFTS